MVRACAALALASAASSLSFAQDGTQAAMERARAAEMSRRAGDDARRLASWELKLLEQRRLAPGERNYDLTYEADQGGLPADSTGQQRTGPRADGGQTRSEGR